MHLISPKNLRARASAFPDVSQPIEELIETFGKAKWRNLEHVREVYRDAEAVGNFTVFNVKGNKYRLILAINYKNGTIYFKDLLTHAEYDKGRWKRDPYF
jgi:mRNA interferase HigB